MPGANDDHDDDDRHSYLPPEGGDDNFPDWTYIWAAAQQTEAAAEALAETPQPDTDWDDGTAVNVAKRVQRLRDELLDLSDELYALAEQEPDH